MGAPGTTTIGGGKAKLTGDAFNQYLLGGLNSGQFGMDAQAMMGQGFSPLTYGQQNFNTSVDMSNPQFAAMNTMLSRQTAQGVNDIRSRFGAAGGAPRGSAAAFAEGNYLAGANPANILAMGELANSIRGQDRADLALGSQDMLGRLGMASGERSNMMNMLFQSLNNAMSIGTPQAQSVQKPSGFGQALGAISTLAPFALAPFTGGASLGLGGIFGAGAGASAGTLSKLAQAGMNAAPGGYGSGNFGLQFPQYPGFR